LKYTPEQGLQMTDQVRDSWPARSKECYEALESKIALFESFQIIANVSHYNHLHDTDHYTDYRGDKMPVIPELVALVALKAPYVGQPTVNLENCQNIFEQIQEHANTYFHIKSAILSQEKHEAPENTLTRLTHKLAQDELHVRNPGLPDHHRIISTELFMPMDDEIRKHFGFGIKEAIIIRESIIGMINHRYSEHIKRAFAASNPLISEVIVFRNTGRVKAGSELSRNQLLAYSNMRSKAMKNALSHRALAKANFYLQDVYAFTAAELAEYCKIPGTDVDSFLKHFSTDFNTVKPEQEVLTANSILRTKPVLKNEDRYIVPSYAMFTWCTEPVYESYINTQPKLLSKYKKVKHDYLLNEGIRLLSSILKGAEIFPQNLYYQPDKLGRCETDGMIGYDRTLFIIEAKGNRFSQKAKDGSYIRTEKHLKEIVRDSTEQGRRTKKYIQENVNPVFRTEIGKKIAFDPGKYDDFIVISLTLEPIGNLVPILKVANDLEYFVDDVFPWIISIYDLLVFADLIEMPVLLLHYLKRRKRFLEAHYVSIYEELDMLAYFLNNGLYIEETLKEGEEKNISHMSFANNTDEINDYYMYYFGHKHQFTEKPSYFLKTDYMTLLKAVEDSCIPNRTVLMLEMLKLGTESIKKLINFIKDTKIQFIQDGQLHDCSIIVGNGDLGITFMVGPDQEELDQMLYEYCNFKFKQTRVRIWVGIGDLECKEDAYAIRCSVIVKDRIP